MQLSGSSIERSIGLDEVNKKPKGGVVASFIVIFATSCAGLSIETPKILCSELLPSWMIGVLSKHVHSDSLQ